eukprot:m.31828 g.31828  ORF g.31828 m.31828 type:complete len:515 (-) comp9346_c0_seq1:30-1574(-)
MNESMCESERTQTTKIKPPSWKMASPATSEGKRAVDEGNGPSCDISATPRSDTSETRDHYEYEAFEATQQDKKQTLLGEGGGVFAETPDPATPATTAPPAAAAAAAAGSAENGAHVGGEFAVGSGNNGTLLTPRLEIVDESASAADITAEARTHLAAVDPLLPHLMVVKVVKNERRTFVNIRVKREYLRLIFHQQHGDVFFCFFPDDTLEPFVKIIALHKYNGEIKPIPPELDADLTTSINAFKAHHQISNESYCFQTPSQERICAPALSQTLTTIRTFPPHLYNLSMRVASAMYRHKMPITAALDLPSAQRAIAAARARGSRHEAWHTFNGTLLKSLLQVNHTPDKVPPITVELRSYFLLTLFAVERNGVLYEIHLSDKLEPFAIACAIHPAHGLLVRLTRAQVEDLTAVLGEFKRKYQIVGETYHYTTLEERLKTDEFTRRAGVGVQSKAHSTDFHLKIRVPTLLCRNTLSILHLVDFARMRTDLEPIAYQYSRDTLAWDQVLPLLLQDAHQ